MKCLKIILAALLLVCLLHLPYGLYNLIRFVAMAGFVMIAVDYFKQSNDALVITFACLALLFQPFIKIALGRTIWNIVDVAVAIFLILLIAKNQHK